MRIPDPKANTTTEAYLAYKAGFLEESELKPKLYKPDWHFDGWLAYWAGLVNTYPTKENGDPEMLCDEEALVAYLSGVTDTYPEEIKDPYDVRIVGYLKYLISARFGRPEYPVNNEEFYLSTMDAPHTSNETPSADIELDTSEGKIISVEAYGDTYQQTYSGKNLLPYPYADGDSKTAKGITYTVNADGTVILNGQNDGTASAAYFFIDRYGSMPLFELSAGTYCFIPNTKGVEYEAYDGTRYYGFSANNNFTVTFPTNVSIRQLYAFVRDSNQTQFNNYKIYPMLTTVAGQTELDYEPYTGGIPAPNPDYPQAVQVVTGEQTVTTTGKNLSSISGYNGIGWGIAKSDFAAVLNSLSAGTYTISMKLTLKTRNDTSDASVYGIYFVNSVSGSVLDRNSTWGTSAVGDSVQFTKTFTITESNAGKFTSAYFYGCGINGIGDTGSADITNIQLEQGSTPTAYQPYQSQSYEINLGKNLFRVPETPDYENTGTIYTKISEGSFSIEVNPAATWKDDRFLVTGLQPNTTYTFKATFSNSNSSVTNNWFMLRDGGINGTVLQQSSINSSTSKTFTTTNNTTIAICLSATVGTAYENTMTVSNIQLELGSTATSYAPYFTPIELCKIGDYQDYIYKSGDDWYVHKETGSYTFNGSETWQLTQTFTNTVHFVIGDYTTIFTDVVVPPDNTTIGHGLSNRFIEKANLYNVDEVGMDFHSNKNFIVGIPTSMSIATHTAWENWLASNSTSIYYALATPTDTQITDATLVGQLEALANADTYNEKTYIKVTANDPNLPALLKVEAYKY